MKLNSTPAFVIKKSSAFEQYPKRYPQASPKRHPLPVMGDQFTYVALASTTRGIIGYRTVKRDGATTDDFYSRPTWPRDRHAWDSTGGMHYYKPAIRDAFG